MTKISDTRETGSRRSSKRVIFFSSFYATDTQIFLIYSEQIRNYDPIIKKKMSFRTTLFVFLRFFLSHFTSDTLFYSQIFNKLHDEKKLGTNRFFFFTEWTIAPRFILFMSKNCLPCQWNHIFNDLHIDFGQILTNKNLKKLLKFYAFLALVY